MELATATFNETFTRKSDLTTCWGLFDLGTSIVQVQVPVTYRYHLCLRDSWHLELKGRRLVVHAPEIKPSLPPAIHTDQLTTLAFMFASTNLVLELGFILWLLLGWTFLLAEAIGAFVLIAVMWLLVKLTLPKGLVEAARAHTGDEVKSCCHSHESDMEEKDESFKEKIGKPESWADVADAFIMDVSMMWKEILIGFFIAGLLMALVPDNWWRNLFITQGTGPVRLIENAIIGPLIAVASFVCSVGNIPLASLLWSSGISFGGVISFIYADLIIIPLILIYRKYYGGKAALYITAVLFVSMVSAGIIVDLLFGALGLIPNVRSPSAIAQASFQWDYTTWLDFAAILLSGWFVWIHFKKRKQAGEPEHAH